MFILNKIINKINELSTNSYKNIFNYVNTHKPGYTTPNTNTETSDNLVEDNHNTSPNTNIETSDDLVKENHNTSPNTIIETSDDLVEENHNTSPNTNTETGDDLNNNLVDNILNQLSNSN